MGKGKRNADYRSLKLELEARENTIRNQNKEILRLHRLVEQVKREAAEGVRQTGVAVDGLLCRLALAYGTELADGFELALDRYELAELEQWEVSASIDGDMNLYRIRVKPREGVET